MANGERLATPIVRSVDDVPEGFVRLSKFVRAACRNHRVLATFVRGAVERGRRRGGVSAIKVCTNAAHVHYAPVFVNREQADAALLEALPVESLAEAARRASETVNGPVPVMALPGDKPAAVSVSVAADTESLVVELQALRASVAELTRGMRDLQAAVELQAESELSGTPYVQHE